MPKTTRRTLEKAAFDLLVTKYRANPKSFERQFSDVGQIVRQAVEPRRVSRPSFRMTEREKRHHTDSLNAILDMEEIPPQDATRGIEHCAVLIQDELLTPHVNRDRVLTLFKAAYGKSLESARKNTVIPVEGRGTGDPVYHSSLLRGVVADLNLDMRLVSITITPRKIREGKKMMSIVGIAHDSCDDLSIRHDDYLAEIYYDELHGVGWRDRP